MKKVTPSIVKEMLESPVANKLYVHRTEEGNLVVMIRHENPKSYDLYVTGQFNYMTSMELTNHEVMANNINEYLEKLS